MHNSEEVLIKDSLIFAAAYNYVVSLKQEKKKENMKTTCEIIMSKIFHKKPRYDHHRLFLYPNLSRLPPLSIYFGKFLC